MSTDQEEEEEEEEEEDTALEALAELASSSPDISEDELDDVARCPTPVNPTVLGDHD